MAEEPKLTREEIFRQLGKDYRGCEYVLDGNSMVRDMVSESKGSRKQITRYDLGYFEKQPVIVFDPHHPEQMYHAHKLLQRLREMGVEPITIAPLREDDIRSIRSQASTLTNIADLVERQKEVSLKLSSKK